MTNENIKIIEELKGKDEIIHHLERDLTDIKLRMNQEVQGIKCTLEQQIDRLNDQLADINGKY